MVLGLKKNGKKLMLVILKELLIKFKIENSKIQTMSLSLKWLIGIVLLIMKMLDRN
jgi:hypothetical protein